jgi:beta-lactamase regulating signal transducer with metallopeptidase domain
MNPMEISAAAFTKVAEASLAASILALVVLLIQFALRSRLTPAWRFALWLPVLLRLLLPYVPEAPTSFLNFRQWIPAQATFENAPPLPASFEPTLKVDAPYGVRRVHAALDGAQLSQNQPLPPQPSSLPWPTILAFLWLSVSLLLLTRLLLGSLWFNLRLSKNQLLRKPELVELLARLRADLNLRANPQIIETSLVSSPCLFGFFKPRLLLPADLHSQLTQSELSHVILHELAHLKRRDLFTNSLMAVAQAIHWFNPIAWLVFRKMRLERELACDQIVLQSRAATDPKAYGQTLLKLLHDFTPIPSTPALVGIAEDKHSATLRLSQIAQFTPRRSRFSTIGWGLLLATILIGLTNAQTKSPEPPKTIDTTASAQNTNKNPNSDPALRAKGLEALEKEYERQKKIVNEALDRVDKLRTELGIVASFADGTPTSTAAQEHDELVQQLSAVRQKYFENKALIEQLKRLSRDDLRKALPTALQPPDEQLNRYLADLGRAEQEYQKLSLSHSDEHLEVQRITTLLTRISIQIEDRIDGIMLGLEARRSTAQNMVEALERVIANKGQEDAQARQRYRPYFEAKRSLEESQRVLDTIFMRLLAEKVDSQVPK